MKPSGRLRREIRIFHPSMPPPSGGGRCCYVLIGGDRGLAGGYNANLFRCLEEAAGDGDYSVLPIGKKAVEYVRRRKLDCVDGTVRTDRGYIRVGLL